jgi:hypothetical protein
MFEERHTSCLFSDCPKPSWSEFRAMHFAMLELQFDSSEINGTFICGPPGGGKNDIQCNPGEVLDQFTIQSRGK